MTNLKLSAKEIAHGRWSEILQAAGIDRQYLTKKETPCPLCGGTSRFCYYDKTEGGRDGDRVNPSGLYSCRHCGGGNGLGLLMGYLGLSAKEAFQWIEQWYYGMDIVSRPVAMEVPSKPVVSPEELILAARAKHKKIWSESRPVVEGDPVYLYLSNRIPGFTKSHISPMIRFHPALDYRVQDQDGHWKSLGLFPAMVAYVMWNDGLSQDLHRTYLTKNGFKADVPDPKKTLKSSGLFGGAVRLSNPKGNVLAVSEGIETAYAVEIFKNLPCWPLLNTYNMTQFAIPSNIEYLHIFEDNDLTDMNGVKVGAKAAKALKDRAEAKGVTVRIHSTAKQGTDFLDLLVGIRNSKNQNLVAF